MIYRAEIFLSRDERRRRGFRFQNRPLERSVDAVKQHEVLEVAPLGGAVVLLLFLALLSGCGFTPEGNALRGAIQVYGAQAAVRLIPCPMVSFPLVSL